MSKKYITLFETALFESILGCELYYIFIRIFRFYTKRGTDLLAVLNGKFHIVNILIDHGAQIQAKTKNHGETPLHIAVRKGKLEVAKILIDRGAQIEAKNNIEITPLHWAVDEHHLEIAQFLIEKGAQIETKGKNGLTLLHKAANNGDLEMTKLLIDKAKFSYTRPNICHKLQSSENATIAKLMIFFKRLQIKQLYLHF